MLKIVHVKNRKTRNHLFRRRRKRRMSLNAAAHGRFAQHYRVRTEIADLNQNPRCYIKEIKKIPKYRDIYQIKFLGDGIYKKSIFTISIDVSVEYPFKPPYVKFVNPMHHPNVDQSTGEICSSMLTSENWKPETTMDDIIINIICLLTEPDLSRPVNFDAADECMKNRAKYLQNCINLAEKLQ